jgi:2-polyprenyl-3-methyl-5-hydroxy-6-metoxy-1,4-benzoquinol methylase
MGHMRSLTLNRNRFICDLIKGKAVLDVGCVNHRVEFRAVSHWLHGGIAESAKSVVGLDYEAGEVAKLKEMGFNVVVGDATDFDLKRKFDVVVAGEIMEHLLNAGGFLKCARRHLKPGGLLVLSTPNAIGIVYMLQNLLRGRELDNPDHICLYSQTTMTTLLAKCGFRVKSIVFYPEAALDCRESATAYYLRQALQLSVAWFRPSVCHHFITIAEPITEDGVC